MGEQGKPLDPRLLQARWVLSGVGPEEWVDQAALALDQGFDGTAVASIRIGELGLRVRQEHADRFRMAMNHGF